MSITLAGSTGGLVGLKRNDHTYLIKLFTGNMNYDEFHNWFVKRQTLRVASLVVNNRCNLKCRHCYLQVKNPTGRKLDMIEWEKVIDSIASMKPGLICVSGKEVFIDPKGPDLLLHLRKIKNSHNEATRIGFITNGTFLHKHKKTVLAMNPDYLDISLDGTEEYHDAIRGKGSFSKAFPNVKWAAGTFRERFFTSLTIHKLNAANFIETVDFLQKNGIHNIAAVFYKPQPYTDAGLTLSDTQVDELFTRLHRLNSLNPEIPIKVMLDLDTSHLSSVKSFMRSEWFNVSSIKEDENGNLFIRHKLDNGGSLLFRLHIVPGIERSRITPEGNLLAAGDTLNTERYAEYSIGNVRDFGYNFPALYNYALYSKRLELILQEYYNKTLPLLVKEVKGRFLGGRNYEYRAA